VIDQPSHNRILLVDSDDRFRERIGGILSDYGFEVTHAKSSPSALEEVSRHKPTLCILETNLAGVDGIQLLRYFRSRHLFRTLPVVVLTSGIVKSELANLVKLDVKGIFVKSEFSIDALLKKIQDLTLPPEYSKLFGAGAKMDSCSHGDIPSSHLAHSTHHADPAAAPKPASGTPPIRNLDGRSIESLVGMKTISVILEDLVSVASRGNSSLDDLEAVIRKDPIVAARLVRAANSAAFLRGAPVNRIEDSLRVLGFTNVIRVAVAGGCLTKDELGGEAGPDIKEIWANSLCMAMVAEKMASRQESAKCYMQGILSNLPILFLIQFLGTDWFAWKQWAAGRLLTFGELVESSTGMPLTKYVDQLYQSLKFSPELSKPLVDSYRFYLTRSREEPGPQSRKIDLWAQLATILGRGVFDFHVIRPLSEKEVRANDVGSVVDPAFSQEVGLIEASFGVLAEGRHLHHEGYGQILFWRDPRWSGFDPVVAHLENFADCLVVDAIAEFRRLSGRRIAFVEPGTSEWAALEPDASILLLHTEAVSDGVQRPRESMMKLPICMRDLTAHLDRFFQVGSEV